MKTKSNMTDKEKEIWTVSPPPECKHPKNKVIKTILGWLCLGCTTYIDKDMITDSKTK